MRKLMFIYALIATTFLGFGADTNVRIDWSGTNAWTFSPMWPQIQDEANGVVLLKKNAANLYYIYTNTLSLSNLTASGTNIFTQNTNLLTAATNLLTQIKTNALNFGAGNSNQLYAVSNILYSAWRADKLVVTNEDFNTMVLQLLSVTNQLDYLTNAFNLTTNQLASITNSLYWITNSQVAITNITFGQFVTLLGVITNNQAQIIAQGAIITNLQGQIASQGATVSNIASSVFNTNGYAARNYQINARTAVVNTNTPTAQTNGASVAIWADEYGRSQADKAFDPTTGALKITEQANPLTTLYGGDGTTVWLNSVTNTQSSSWGDVSRYKHFTLFISPAAATNHWVYVEVSPNNGTNWCRLYTNSVTATNVQCLSFGPVAHKYMRVSYEGTNEACSVSFLAKP